MGITSGSGRLVAGGPGGGEEESAVVGVLVEVGVGAARFLLPVWSAGRSRGRRGGGRRRAGRGGGGGGGLG